MTQANAVSPEAQALLSQLHDIRAPDPVSWWPPAPGWWLLALLVMLAIAVAVTKAVKHRHRNRYRRAAQESLARISASDADAAIQISALLKRTALTAYPHERDRIASLFGDPWVRFLNNACPRPVFTGAAAETLANDLYKPLPPSDISTLQQQASSWISQHRRSAGLPTTATSPEPANV